ncbi:MAG: hypothetical protein M3014_07790 [Chloroflexota bacterium]|nr:hypothetical protein [Chloroflexota bacterium]
MITNIYTRWMVGGALALALGATFTGVGSASAHALDAQISKLSAVADGASASAATGANTVQLSAQGNTVASPGTALTVSSSLYSADEDVSMWINVPDGTAISQAALGQTDTQILDTVIPLDTVGSATDDGAFSYTLDTTGLSAGNYSLVAYGRSSGHEEVRSFTITPSPPLQLKADGPTTVAAGTILTVNGTQYGADENLGLWINVPDGTVIYQATLGQTDSYVDGSVIPLDAMGVVDDNGSFTYKLDTSGLPNGSYSLVAHGLATGLDEVLLFTIK